MKKRKNKNRNFTKRRSGYRIVNHHYKYFCENCDQEKLFRIFRQHGTEVKILCLDCGTIDAHFHKLKDLQEVRKK